MDKLSDGITTDQQRIREDGPNVALAVTSLILLLAVLAAFFIFG